jgi:hypothetical protein
VAGLQGAHQLVELLVQLRGSQDPVEFLALEAARSMEVEQATEDDLPVYGVQEWAAGDFRAAAFPGRSAAWSSALREAAPLLVAVAESFAPVED